MMRNQKLKRLFLIVVLSSIIFFACVLSSHAAMRTRIVVLPFYAEQGEDVDTGLSDRGFHYRRISGFIENRLVRHHFEVIDPFAKDASEIEWSRVMETSREDSALACRDMANRFAVDAVYLVWIEVNTRKTADGYWKASVILDGKGYDSAGRSLGANVLKTFKATKRDFNEAVAVVEEEVGDIVGRTLTGWKEERMSGNTVQAYSETNGETQKGLLAARIENQAKYVSLRLDLANEYEIVEAFGKVVNTVRGVVYAKQYNMRIVSDNPQACVTEWGVEINPEETDSFRLQANIMKMINDILDAGGQINMKGVMYRYTSSEKKLLMGIRPGTATAGSVQFIIDRERMRNQEFFSRHYLKKSVKKGKN
ncbi:MAG: hypothetical protein GY699_02735 [Desulfobacteraceae bacterium]|nr:hypothetical protein [Desulfobacteraceae bacterium]